MKQIRMTVMIAAAACAGWVAADDVNTILQSLETAGTAPAQTAEQPAADAAAGVSADVISLAAETAPGSSMQDGLISLSLKGVTLQEVVRLFSQLSNANIIVPSLVPAGEAPEPRMDVNLTNVEWKPALQAILETQGMELYEKIPGTAVYGIRPKIPDAPEPLEVRVFKLDYATVSSVTNLMAGLVGEGGGVAAFPARNVIVVKSTTKALSEIEEIIKRVDLPREQVFIEAKFMELTDSASDKLGIDWQTLSGYNMSAGPFGANYSKTKTDAGTIGTTAGGGEAPALYGTPAGSGLFFENQGPDFVQTLESQTMSAVLNADKFNLVLSALKEINGVKIVSNPKVIVANEETATIHIGAKKPNVRGTTTTAGETQLITTYALDAAEPYFTDGIKVDVTPTVNTENNIAVKIQPTLERLDSEPTKAPDGTLFFGKSTKTITTVFGLQSGQTAAIGGLTEVTNSDFESKIPVLGSIPLLGRLFSYNSKTKNQAETIIFVTVGMANPDLITPETGLPEDTSLARRYKLTSGTDRAAEREKIKVLETTEQERLESIVNAVREAEQKRVSQK